MEKINYKQIADNDFTLVSRLLDNGDCFFHIPALVQETCEKYLKHIVAEYCVPENDDETAAKASVLRTHSLRVLLSYLNKAGLSVEPQDRAALMMVEGMYFTTRYPSDDFYIMQSTDIETCKTALSSARHIVSEIENNIG